MTRDRVHKSRIDHGDMRDEIACQRAAGPLAPRVLAVAGDGFTMQRVRGRALGALADESDDVLAEIGRALAALHMRKVSARMRALPSGATLAATLNEAETALRSVRLNVDVVRAVRARLREARARVDEIDALTEPPRALCHGDLRAPNLKAVGRLKAVGLKAVGLKAVGLKAVGLKAVGLKAVGPKAVGPKAVGLKAVGLKAVGRASVPVTRITFVDFGLAGRGDPAVDLARLLAYESLTGHARFALLDAYAESARDGDATVDRALAIADVMPLCLALSALRYATLAARGAITVHDPRAFRARIPALSRRVRALLVGQQLAAAARRGPIAIPRVPHVSTSRLGNDDLTLPADVEARVRNRRVHVCEKLDGVAVAIFLDDDGAPDLVMKRDWRHALGGRIDRAARRWSRAHANELRALFAATGARGALCEWLRHRLATRYDRLPAALVVHALVDARGHLIPRARTLRAIARAGLVANPPLRTCVVGSRAWSTLLPRASAYGARRAEGVVIEWREADGAHWAKWVAPHYRQPRGVDVTGVLNRVWRP